MKPKHKKLVYESQELLDKFIEQYKAKGWRLVRTITDYWKSGETVYIAELIKSNHYDKRTT